MRINPFNGRLQQSDDGGLTWFDVEDGPWTESLYPPFSAMPSPRPEATEYEKRCAAAATAAYVLVNLYTQTGNTLLNVVAATDWEYAGALGSMLTGFLMTIGAVATQPYVAIGTLLGIVGVRQQYVDYPLDADDEERLTCILLENATLQPSAAVTFDFQAVWDTIDLVSPKNGLVRFLLTMIGPDALNYAGAIDAGLTPDCTPCGEWCHHFDFEPDQAGWSTLYGNYYSGFGWSTLLSTGTDNVEPTISFAETFITRVVAHFSVNWSGPNPRVQVRADGGTPIGQSTATGSTDIEVTVNTDASFIGVNMDKNIGVTNAGWEAGLYACGVTVYGTGTNPFGESNC